MTKEEKRKQQEKEKQQHEKEINDLAYRCAADPENSTLRTMLFEVLYQYRKSIAYTSSKLDKLRTMPPSEFPDFTQLDQENPLLDFLDSVFYDCFPNILNAFVADSRRGEFVPFFIESFGTKAKDSSVNAYRLRANDSIAPRKGGPTVVYSEPDRQTVIPGRVLQNNSRVISRQKQGDEEWVLAENGSHGKQVYVPLRDVRYVAGGEEKIEDWEEDGDAGFYSAWQNSRFPGDPEEAAIRAEAQRESFLKLLAAAVKLLQHLESENRRALTRVFYTGKLTDRVKLFGKPEPLGSRVTWDDMMEQAESSFLDFVLSPPQDKEWSIPLICGQPLRRYGDLGLQIPVQVAKDHDVDQDEPLDLEIPLDRTVYRRYRERHMPEVSNDTFGEVWRRFEKMEKSLHSS